MRFALRRADFNISIEGGEAKLETVALSANYQPHVTVTEETETKRNKGFSKKRARHKNTSSRLIIKASPQGELGTAASENHEVSDSHADDVREKVTRTFDRHNFDFSGSRTSLNWTFLPTAGRTYLSGKIPVREWMRFSCNKKSSQIVAQIFVHDLDIEVIGVTGIWPSILTERKRRVVRFLALRSLNFKPYLSRIEISVIDSMLEQRSDQNVVQSVAV